MTNGLVTKAKLHEIEKELDTQVLPRIAKFEKGSSDAHLKAVTLTKDFIEACHIADTIKHVACIKSGEKAIDDVYADFRVPVKTVNTVVVDTANAINVLNKIMETELSVSMRPIIAIKNPMDDVARAIHAVEKVLHKVVHDIKKAIHKLEPHIKVDGFNMSDIDLAFLKFRTDLNFKDINFGLGAYGIAIKGISLGIHGLQTCK